jgi:hypothetical protein
VTDLQASLVAAIQQVRTSTPRECDYLCLAARQVVGRSDIHSTACDERWQVKADARLAACVDAAIEASGQEGADAMNAAHLAHEYHGDSQEAGLAAFLAAAAQKGHTT